MHERLAADDAEEDIAHDPRFANKLMKCLRFHRFQLRGNIDPAALAAQVTAVDDGDIEKGRKHLAAFQAALVSFDRQHPPQTHVPGKLPQEALVGFEEKAFEEGKIHVRYPSYRAHPSSYPTRPSAHPPSPLAASECQPTYPLLAGHR